MGLWFRLDDQAIAIDCEADSGSGLQMQQIEDSWRKGQHDRTADPAEIGGIHGGNFYYIILKYSTVNAILQGLIGFARLRPMAWPI